MKLITTPHAGAIALWAIACAAFGAFAIKAIANGAAAACACQVGGW
jgi:hypothetical protein